MNGIILNSLSGREKAIGPFADASSDADPKTWRHWSLKRDSQDIAWLMFDCEDASVNVLSHAVLEELGAAKTRGCAQCRQPFCHPAFYHHCGSPRPLLWWRTGVGAGV